ncbi:helix-turn-helix transcriptional regulator [Azospirillum sp. YIM B02556]|uniref:Helix-turn-helix transcriptional regulator n=1 Tax=Azospirillum endophyticum TaxID=2800326 RepID=A0ABS1FAH7_9PROT|nr:AraC family transcriptional regulator [Azospirillum endophyticum]MBK1840416.1 helix-turn-helix transcriptional regulator [Azospirillum endophyticum]
MSADDGRALHENVVRIERRVHTWNCVTVIDVEEHTRGEVLHALVNDEETGVAMALEEVGGVTEPRLEPDRACMLDHRPNHMTLVPKGMPLWGHGAKDLHYSRYALLLFDLDALEARFEEDFDARMFARPRLRFTDDRIHALVRMLINIPDRDASMTLLGDSLTSAVFALLSRENERGPAGTKLSCHALRLVESYIRDQLPRRIELRELAELAQMSQWHFSRGFKASTGLSPYQWQLTKRLERVKELLLRSDAPLNVIAKATGFCNATHLIRAFERRTGEAPAVWRRDGK